MVIKGQHAPHIMPILERGPQDDCIRVNVNGGSDAEGIAAATLKAAAELANKANGTNIIAKENEKLKNPEDDANKKKKLEDKLKQDKNGMILLLTTSNSTKEQC
jgi:hypothetical protein